MKNITGKYPNYKGEDVFCKIHWQKGLWMLVQIGGFILMSNKSLPYLLDAIKGEFPGWEQTIERGTNMNKYYVNYAKDAGTDSEDFNWNGWYVCCTDQSSAKDILNDTWDSQTPRTKEGFYGPFRLREEASKFILNDLLKDFSDPMSMSSEVKSKKYRDLWKK